MNSWTKKWRRLFFCVAAVMMTVVLAGCGAGKSAGGDVAKADAALARRAEYPENLGRGKPYPKDE